MAVSAAASLARSWLTSAPLGLEPVSRVFGREPRPWRALEAFPSAEQRFGGPVASHSW